jgi:quinoprotein glucose dehydrogenase
MEHTEQDQRRTGRCASLAVLALGVWLGDVKAQPAASGQAASLPNAVQGTNAPSPELGVASATLAQWRAELAELGTTNAATETAISAWLDRLLAGQVAKEVHLELLEAARKHNSPAIKEKLARHQDARLEEGGIATSSELLYGGNAERGRKIYFEKPEAACIKCHKVGQEGGEIGPPLTGATTNRTREFILESILQPNAQITPGYETYSIVLKDRTSYHGIIKQETETALILNCPPDEESFTARLVTIQKADIASRRKGGSSMPDGLDMALPPRDARDLLEFLAGLKPDGAQRDAGVTQTPGQQNGEVVQETR